MALRGRKIANFLELWWLVASGVVGIWVSSTSFQKSSIGWPQQPLTEIVLISVKNWIFDDPFHKKGPVLVIFCGMVHQKSKLSLIYGTVSVRGCWGQPILLFWKLEEESQMSKCPEATRHHNSTKLLIFPSLRAIQFRPFQYDTPCT